MGEILRFSKQAAIFILIVLLVVFLINLVYTSEVLTKKTFYRKEMIYQTHIAQLPNKHIDYLFFGDSHAFHAINPEFIPESHNYATGAENYIKTYYKLRKTLEIENVRVEAIVLELDPHTFSTRLTDETNLFSEVELYKDFVSLKEINKVRDDSWITLWLEANVPVLGNGKEFGILVRDLELAPVSEKGWFRNAGNFSLVDKEAAALFNYKSLYENQERISNVSFEYFLKTLELAQEHNVHVVFIMYPHTQEYEGIINEKNITKEDYYDFIFSQVNETLEDYDVLNYYSLFPEKDYLFGDPEHVNYIGSEILSKKINEDLWTLNLKESRQPPIVEREAPSNNNKEGDYLAYILIIGMLAEVILLVILLMRKI